MSNPLFRRHVDLLVSGLRLSSPGLAIDFISPFDDDPEPDITEVVIYNLSDDTVNRLRKGATAVLNAGYEGDVGTVALGVVEGVYGAWEGPTRATRLMIGDATDRWAQATISRSYAAGIRASAIIHDLVRQFGLEVGALQLPSDPVYHRGRSVSGPLQAVLREVATDAGAQVYISQGAVFVRGRGDGTQTGFVLRSDTGLIDSPQRIERDEGEGWGVWSLLNHRIRTGALIRVESKTVVGNFRVAAGQHVCNNSDFLTYMELMPAQGVTVA